MTPNPQLPAGAPGGAQSRTSGLAIAALIFGILGVCLPCPFGVVSIILGIVALVKMKSDAGMGGRAMAIAGIALPLVALVVVVPIMAAIAIPNYVRFQARSKQAECRMNLKSAFTAQKSYFLEHDTYETRAQQIGFIPERGNRYAYFLAAEGPLEDRSTPAMAPDENATGIGVDTFKYPEARALMQVDLPPSLAGDVRVGVAGKCPECSFTAVCAGNIDNDLALDVWSVSSQERTGPDGQVIMPGEVFNDVNDVTQ